MNMKALITTLALLGTSAIAMAQPSWRDHRTETRDRYRHPREEPRMLGDALYFGDTEYRKDVIVGPEKGSFRTIIIDAEGGRTFIQKIGIEFDNGQTQVVNIRRVLKGRRAFAVNLTGGSRQIARIFIYRADGERGININKRHNGAFSVVGL